LLCETSYVDGVAVERCGVSGGGCFLLFLGGFSLSPCFCEVLNLDHFLFWACPLRRVSSHSGGAGRSEEWGGRGGGVGACGLVG